MTQADTAVEIHVAPGDVASVTSVRKSLETLVLSPEDLAFCQTNTELTPVVKELRAMESILQTGIFPDEANGFSDWPTIQLDYYTSLLLNSAGVEAVPVVLRNAYETVYNFDSKSQNTRGTGYLGMVDVYMRASLGAGIIHNDDRYHQAVEQALQPLLYKRGGGSEEQYAGRFLTYKGQEGFLNMRVIDRPLDSTKSFDYYGVSFAIDGLPEGGDYSVSELEIGVLGVHDHQNNNRIVNIINIHPDRYNYQAASEEIHVLAIEPKELFHQILGRDVPGFEEDAEKFLYHYVPFYHEAPFAEGRFTRFFDRYDRYGWTHSNANVLPLEAKYYLWKNLCELSGSYDETLASNIYSLLNTYGPDVAWVVQALNGDKNVLANFVNAFVSETPDQTTTNLFHAIAQSEQYIVEAAYTVTASAGDTNGIHIQDRINYLLPIARGMAREALEHSDSSKAMRLFTLGFAQYQKMLNLLYAHHDPNIMENAPFDQFQLDKIDEFRGKFPNAPITGRMMTTADMVHVLFNQRGIPADKRNKWLWEFYRHVIELGVYTPEKASVYVDTDLEITREVEAMKTLHSKNLLPREEGRGRWRLSVGCGDGNRVERHIYERLQKELPAAMPTMVVGLDMFPQKEAALWHRGSIGSTEFSFVESPLEDVLKNRPDFEGKFHAIDLHGSALNNMDLYGLQLLYFSILNRLLHPGGILMMDTGAIEPAAHWNERTQSTRRFQKLFPNSPPGAIGIISEYQRPTDEPGDIGAIIYPYPSLVQIAGDSGFELIGGANDPGFEARLRGIYQDPRVLLQETIRQQNAFLQPLYVANAPEKPEPGMNIRMTLFWKKIGDPRFNPFVVPFLEARQILVGDSQRAV